MTPEKQRTALAEWRGWKRPDHPDVMKFKEGWTRPEEWWMCPQGVLRLKKDIPDYLNDLNAVHELEKNLTDEEHLCFRVKLWDMVIESTDECRWDRNFISATAAHRCKALLKTLNLWKP